MSNFFTDNADLLFTLDNLEIQEAMSLIEKDYTEAQKYDTAPESFEDALDSFHRILDVIGDVAGERIAPRARQVDEEGPKFENGVVTYHPLTVQNLNDLKAAGVMGVILPRQYGGLNFPLSVYTMMTEMVSRADASLQNLFGLQDIADTICEFGSEEQRQKYIPRFVTGEADGSMDLTEPDSGSDLQSVRLKATQDADGKWYLDGMKRFITNGCSQIHLVLARSEEGTTDGRGLSMFICEKCPQLVVRRIEHKMGIHGVATCELQFNHVPAELCGMRKRGLIKYVMSLMNGARVSISAQAVGIAEAAYREARKYASEREQFKQSIDKFPAIYDMLARMKTQLAASRALLYETTRCVDLRQAYTHLAEGAEKPDPAVREKAKLYVALCDVLTPMSKALSTESANKIAYDCIQIHGGTGYMHDFDAERLYRDARITNIYEGTTQLQVVAAIGGVMSRTLDGRIAEMMAGIPDEGLSGELKKIVAGMLEQHRASIEFVAGMKATAPDYRNLRARALVENETFIFVGMLLLRDAQKDASREAVAERYIRDAKFDFLRNYELIMSGDCTTIARHEEVIAY
jgi:alkylation response protein AidB-like acyl-CoA dehydrogenase